MPAYHNPEPFEMRKVARPLLNTEIFDGNITLPFCAHRFEPVSVVLGRVSFITPGCETFWNAPSVWKFVLMFKIE